MTKQFRVERSHKRDFLIVSESYDQNTVAEWIETVGHGVSAGFHSREGHPDHVGSWVFKPCLGAEEKKRDLAYLDEKHDGMGYCYLKP